MAIGVTKHQHDNGGMLIVPNPRKSWQTIHAHIPMEKEIFFKKTKFKIRGLALVDCSQIILHHSDLAYGLMFQVRWSKNANIFIVIVSLPEKQY